MPHTSNKMKKKEKPKKSDQNQDENKKEKQDKNEKGNPQKQKEEKQAKQPKQVKAQKGQPQKEEERSDFDAIDIRVGKVTSAKKHPEADSLYVEEINLGEPDGARTVLSGLVGLVPLEELIGAFVLIVANFKPRPMKGITSQGMILCASGDKGTSPLKPAEGTKIGERVLIGTHPAEYYSVSFEPLINPKKKNSGKKSNRN